MTYAYARVSTREQNLDRQIIAFQNFGVKKENIYFDKESGKDFQRKSYARLIKKLRAGDLLVIKSIDRLGRNYTAIIAEWSHIVNTKGADILVLDMPLLDTRATPCSLVGKFISDIVLQVLSFVAENEREGIRQRQAEGIAAAHQRGVKFGRPPKQYSPQFLRVTKQYLNKEITLTEGATILGISRENFYYHSRKIALLSTTTPPSPTK